MSQKIPGPNELIQKAQGEAAPQPQEPTLSEFIDKELVQLAQMRDQQVASVQQITGAIAAYETIKKNLADKAYGKQ